MGADESTPTGSGSPVEADPERDSGENAPLEEFHLELRAKNLPVLLWSGVVFNTAYLGWTLFDMQLAPDLWRRFLVYRLIAVTVNTAVVAAVHHPRLRRRTWEAFWIWLFVFGVFIAPMLPVVGGSFAPYVMGFTIVLFGAGLLPFWPTSWAVTNVAAVIGTAVLAFAMMDGDVSGTDLVGGTFFIATGAGLALISARFRYGLALRDYRSRHRLGAALRRETEAKVRLDAMTTELQGALDRAEEVDRLKSRFFANISHELRTPLTLIMAPVEDLVLRLDDPELRRPAEVIRGNARRLLRLIDELLDLTRLDAGHLRLNLAEVDLASLARTVYENSAPAARAASIDLDFVNRSDAAQVWGDAHRLETVITNLVANALRYTPAGGAVTIRVEGDEDAVAVAVADTGPGIGEEHQRRIFDRFYRAGDDTDGGGAGIGLSLARELVQLHGGTLELSSRVGDGSEFRFAIPTGRDHLSEHVVERRQSHRPDAPRRRATDHPEVEQATPESSPPSDRRQPFPPSTRGPAPRTVRRSRILLAEDNAEMREFIAGLLEPFHAVEAVADGATAWERVQRDPPDLVVSDVMMPGLSGNQLCRAIKSDAALRSVPVVLLTARTGSEATLEGYASGADDFVVKPFHPQVLLARITAQLRLRELTFRLADQERFAAVGTLAAGILHEVRNPINAILNGARVLADGAPDDTTAAELAAVVVASAERIQAITAALEEHARPAEGGAATCCDPREGLESTLALLGHRLGDVTIERRYRSDRPVIARPGSLNQVLMNLLDNALRSGATTIRLEVSDVDDSVRVEVGDDGPGVPGHVAGRIFEPFFTTRDTGDGTGLGLYLSRRIVEGFGGTLELDRTVPEGASFVITLPVAPSGAGAD